MTVLFAELRQGNREAEERLIAKVYGELRRLAGHYMRNERGTQSPQSTALVNEASGRLVRQPQVPWQSRVHLFATASTIMRRILVDHARTGRTEERGGGLQRQISLDETLATTLSRTVGVLALREAIERLAKRDERHVRFVELHFFGGLTFDEISLIPEVAERTIRRDWSMAACAWLKGGLSN
jgi:RNA polymerase sigma-70 factor, ECF subfamily